MGSEPSLGFSDPTSAPGLGAGKNLCLMCRRIYRSPNSFSADRFITSRSENDPLFL